MKMLFISSKKLFSISRYLNFCISDFPSLFPFGHFFRRWSKINLKANDVISCLNKNLTPFIWYFEKGKRYDMIACKKFLYKSNILKEDYQKGLKKLAFSFKPHVICMPLACSCILCVCHSYVLACHSYVTHMYSYVICMSVVCTRVPFVCHSYVIRMSLVCTRMSPVCHCYVFICHSYITRM